MSDPTSALRELRDVLRNNPADVDTFTFALSSTLSSIGLSSTSIGTSVPSGALKAVQKNIPGVQQALIAVLPTFLPALDLRGRSLVDAFFCPPKVAHTISVARAVAFSSYLTLMGLLAPSPPFPLPVEAREFVVNTLAALSQSYTVKDLYWFVFGSDSGSGPSTRQLSPTGLLWDDAVRILTTLPAKVANAVGRWREAGWQGDVPPALVPRGYFDSLVVSLEAFLYESAVQMSLGGDTPREAHARDELVEAMRTLFERLITLGVVSAPPTEQESPIPSFFPAFLPNVLLHLHPPADSPLPPYPPHFYSGLFGLSGESTKVVSDALAAYLAFHLIPTSEPLQPHRPDERIKCASIVLSQILDDAKVGNDVWESVIYALLHSRQASSLNDTARAARRRVIVAWADAGGISSRKALINAAMDAWTSPNAIRFGMYAELFSISHTVILSLSLLPQYDPFLVSISRQPRFLQAIQEYLSHPDPKTRRLGMLVAEVISELSIEETGPESKPDEKEQIQDLQAALEIDEETGQPKNKAPPPPRGPRRLKFSNMWAGTGEGKEESRWLRSCVGVKDNSAVLQDDPTGKAWLLGWGENVSERVDITMPTEIEPADEASDEAPRGRKPKIRSRQPKVVMLDDDQANDPLQGYADDDASSSRSPSPTPSFLEEVRSDPSLALDAAKKRKIKRPVYIRQLADLLRDKENADAIDMGLEWGEGLVRAKRSFGGELVENAVAVAAAVINLANVFNLDDFDERRQGLLTALVACSPWNVPAFLAEQYFSTSYSLMVKSVMLTAIAMGARELAGLSVPDAPRTTRKIDFPTKTLPPALHKRYITAADVPREIQQGQGRDQIEDAASSMRNLLLSKGVKKGQEAVPELAREKRLRVGQSGTSRIKVAEEGTLAASQIALNRENDAQAQQQPVVPFSQVAAEHFILPLLNRFWTHFSDATIRESRAVSVGARFRGAGTGMVLSPLALPKFLLTIALLIHAARHAPTFLAVLAPSALEVAVTVGARHPVEPRKRDLLLGGGGGIGPSGGGTQDTGNTKAQDTAPEAQVLGAALDLALTTLDTAYDLDNGRTLATDSPALLGGAAEWAGAVFEAENSGIKSAGAGGLREGRVRAGAAGVVVKTAEIFEKWGGMGMGR